MKASDYQGVVEDWKADLAISRARRLGFKRQDLEDAVQEIIMAVLAFEFDPEKAGGCSEKQSLCGLIDRRLIDLLRSKRRKTCKVDEQPVEELVDKKSEDLDAGVDVRLALERRGETDRDLCKLLSKGRTLNQIAAKLGWSLRYTKNRIAELREYFQQYGLAEYVESARVFCLLENGGDDASHFVDDLDVGIDSIADTATEKNVLNRTRPA